MTSIKLPTDFAAFSLSYFPTIIRDTDSLLSSRMRGKRGNGRLSNSSIRALERSRVVADDLSKASSLSDSTDYKSFKTSFMGQHSNFKQRNFEIFF